MEPEFLIKADAAGADYIRKFRSTTASLHWGNYRGSTLNNGSMFFLYTGKTLFAVTAKHVFEGYMKRAKEQPVLCQIDRMPFYPEKRLISVGPAGVDIATFSITEEEFEEIGRATVPWPPVIPERGNGVLVCGLPGFSRSNPKEFVVDIGYSTFVMRVDSVSDRTLSMLRQPDEEVIDILGTGIAPLGLDIGGMSGGPVAAIIKDSMGTLSWHISGVVCEGHADYNIVQAMRADLNRPAMEMLILFNADGLHVVLDRLIFSVAAYFAIELESGGDATELVECFARRRVRRMVRRLVNVNPDLVLRLCFCLWCWRHVDSPVM
jgi:hypothetical protein